MNANLFEFIDLFRRNGATPIPNNFMEVYEKIKDLRPDTTPNPQILREALEDMMIDKTYSGETVTVPAMVSEDLESLTVTLSPSQDLNGYDKPWAGGAGKNVLPLTVSKLKANNTSGTWSGNNYTNNDVTFSLDTDNGGNITGITVNGTASSTTYFYLSDNSELNYIDYDGTYSVNGCTGGSSSTYGIQVYANESTSAINQFGVSRVIRSESPYTLKNCLIVIRNGYEASNLKFYPMIYLTSSSDESFEPYTNICPITGTDTLTITNNSETVATFTFDNTVYGGTIDVIEGNSEETWDYIASYNAEVLPGKWLSDSDEYAEGSTPTTGAEVCFELATPTTLSTTPTTITLNPGKNVITASSGVIETNYQTLK